MGQRSSGLFQLSSRWAKELLFFGRLKGNRLNDHWSFFQPTQQIKEVQPTKGNYIWIPNHRDHINFLTSTNPIGSMWFFIKESPNVPNMEVNMPFLPWWRIMGLYQPPLFRGWRTEAGDYNLIKPLLQWRKHGKQHHYLKSKRSVWVCVHVFIM